MTDDIKILESVERYISGKMTPDERLYFEQLRKSNAEVDQLVVEHTFFLQQMNRYDETKKFKSVLNDTHIDLAEKGLIRSPRLKGRARVIYMYNRYKKVAGIAASIAGITALTISALVWSLSPGKPAKQSDVILLKKDFERKIAQVHKENRALNAKIDNVKEASGADTEIQYTSGGTGFLIDSKGFLITNAHVVKDAQHVAVQSSGGKDLSAKVIYTDAEKDIAILKITDKSYKPLSSIPYSIRRGSGDLAESIFTLGFPRNDIVYGDGYIASKTGYDGDTLTCQITIPANKGNSGSPVLNRNGEVIGILSKKENSVEGAAFALRSKYILQALNDYQKQDDSYKIKAPNNSSLRGRQRTEQVKEISDYIFMVKVD